MKPSPHLLRKQKSERQSGGPTTGCEIYSPKVGKPCDVAALEWQKGAESWLFVLPLVFTIWFSQFAPVRGSKLSSVLMWQSALLRHPPPTPGTTKTPLRLVYIWQMWRRRRRSLLMLSCYFFNVTQICCLKAWNPLPVCILLAEGRQSMSIKRSWCTLTLISRNSVLPAFSMGK